MTESEPFRVASTPHPVHPWTDLGSGNDTVEQG